MERICSQCHAEVAPDSSAVSCPACGGTLLMRPSLAVTEPTSTVGAAEVDHRGILLPRRHALGGIITPQ
jgi:DNA-directed RNA polymerase subunit RPC12/RpoP